MHIEIIDRKPTQTKEERDMQTYIYDALVIGYDRFTDKWTFKAIPENGDIVNLDLTELKIFHIIVYRKKESQLAVKLTFHGGKRWHKHYSNLSLIQVMMEEKKLKLYTDQDDTMTIALGKNDPTLQKIKIIG